MSDKVHELFRGQVDVPIARISARRRGIVLQPRSHIEGMAAGFTQLLDAPPVQLVLAHRHWRIGTGANQQTNRPCCILDGDRIIWRLLDEEDQLKIYRGNGVFPLVETAQQLRAPLLHGRGSQQRLGEVMPGRGARGVDLRAQLGIGDPVRELIRQIIRESPVINREDAGRGGQHLCQPAALPQARSQLPHRVPLAGLIGQADGHAAGPDETVEAAVGADEPQEIWRDGRALLRGGRLAIGVEVFQLGQGLHRFIRGEHGHGHHEGDIFAFWSAQGHSRAVAEGLLAQDAIDHIREGSLWDC